MNYFIGFVFCTILSVCLCLGVAIYLQPFVGIELDQKTYLAIQLSLTLIPFVASFAAYFQYHGVRLETNPYLSLRVSGVTFIFIFLFSLLYQFLFSDNLFNQMHDDQLSREHALIESRITEYKDLGGLWQQYQRGDLSERRRVRNLLRGLSIEDPYDLTLYRLAMKVERALFQEEQGEDFFNRRKSKLERMAIESRNQRDFQGALQYYKELLSIYPQKPAYASFLEHYQKMAYRMEALDKDPEAQLSDRELDVLFLNRDLEAINALVQDGEYFQAWPKIRTIYVERGNHRDVRSLFELVQARLQEEEFIVSDYLFRLNHIPEKKSYTNFHFHFSQAKFNVEEVFMFKNRLYFSQITMEQSGRVESYTYGLMIGNRLFLKNKVGERSYVIENPSLKKLVAYYPYMIQPKPTLFLLSGLIKMLEIKEVAKDFLGQPISFYTRWYNAKLAYYCSIPGLYIFFLLFSWKMKPTVLHPFRIFFTILCVVGVGIGFYLVSGLLVNTSRQTVVFSHFVIGALTLSFFIINLWLFSLERKPDEGA